MQEERKDVDEILASEHREKKNKKKKDKKKKDKKKKDKKKKDKRANADSEKRQGNAMRIDDENANDASAREEGD
jgi:hypothetical protein